MLQSILENIETNQVQSYEETGRQNGQLACWKPYS